MFGRASHGYSDNAASRGPHANALRCSALSRQKSIKLGGFLCKLFTFFTAFTYLFNGKKYNDTCY
jgi:hypothetical protein